MMKKLLGLLAIGGAAWGARKLKGRKPDTAKVDTAKIDTDQPQKTVQKVEAAVGEPVRP